jgi:hypothetical protein
VATFLGAVQGSSAGSADVLRAIVEAVQQRARDAALRRLDEQQDIAEREARRRLRLEEGRNYDERTQLQDMRRQLAKQHVVGEDRMDDIFEDKLLAPATDDGELDAAALVTAARAGKPLPPAASIARLPLAAAAGARGPRRYLAQRRQAAAGVAEHAARCEAAEGHAAAGGDRGARVCGVARAHAARRRTRRLHGAALRPEAAHAQWPRAELRRIRALALLGANAAETGSCLRSQVISAI